MIADRRDRDERRDRANARSEATRTGDESRSDDLRNVRGAVYSRADAESIAARSLDLEGRHALLASWAAHSFPYSGRVAAEAASTDESGNRESKSDDVAELQDFRNLRESLVERIRQVLGRDSGGAGR